MAHYRKIDVAIWNDDKFSTLKSAGKLAFIFLMSHPNMTGIGAMRATLPGLAAELGISQKDFSEVFKSKLAIFNAAESCVFIPNFIKYQGCESLNVLKSWVSQIQFIPHGKTKDMALAYLHAFVQGKTEAFRLAYDEAYMKAYGQAFVLPKAYPVSSKQLGTPAIEDKNYTREENANDSQMPTLVRVDGKWYEKDTGEEVAA
jgi:hypothetical protein